MPNITNIDRRTMQMLSDELQKLLTAWGARHGLDVQMQPGRYGGINGQFRFEASVRDNGKGISGAQAEWNQFCSLYNLLPEDYGMHFTLNGKQYEVVGLNPNRPKWAVTVKRIHDNQIVSVEPRTIINYRPRKRTAA